MDSSEHMHATLIVIATQAETMGRDRLTKAAARKAGWAPRRRRRVYLDPRYKIQHPTNSGEMLRRCGEKYEVPPDSKYWEIVERVERIDEVLAADTSTPENPKRQPSTPARPKLRIGQ